MSRTLLIIGFVWPEPKSSAAGSRMMQLVHSFLQSNYTITFASVCAKSEKAYDLNSLGIAEERIQLNDSSFDEFLIQLEPDIVLFDRFMTEEQFGWRVYENCPNAIRILDTEDLHFLRKGRQEAVKKSKSFDESFLYNDTAKREIASIYRCDLSLIISQAEVDILKIHFKIDIDLLFYLPFMLNEIGEVLIKTLPKFEERQHFVTIGNFVHAPNLDAVHYLKKTIWPLIKKEIPNAELHIYGSYSSPKVDQLNSKTDGFLIKGFAKDVDEVMRKARVCLAPIRFGAGLKGKLIDAFKNGTPCVTTTIGAEGIFNQTELDGFVFDNPQELAHNAIDMHQNESKWYKIQEYGFSIINSKFQISDFQDKLISAIERIQQNIERHRMNNFIGLMLQYHTLKSTKYMSKWIEEKNK